MCKMKERKRKQFSVIHRMSKARYSEISKLLGKQGRRAGTDWQQLLLAAHNSTKITGGLSEV